MKTTADFLVNKRYLLFIATLVLAAFCAVLAVTVKTNRDMTKYLPEGSNMKQGLSIIEEDFPEPEEKAFIRVMFDGLTAEEIATVKSRLEHIPYVNSVSYEALSDRYNKGEHTLFLVGSRYDYGTAEEEGIETALENGFPEYEMQYQNNDMQPTQVPPLLLAGALALAVIILLIMSESWLEPALFLAATGIAVVINMGTNIFLPFAAETTVSIGPILQLVLSMDYSIILMNRYRREKALCGDKLEAMKTALKSSVSSVASSALTTAVGLLALVFLSFRLGPELGIVLAKGVFISMICTFSVLPVLILLFDKGIERSRKKAPRLSMGVPAKFSHRLRHIMPVFFVCLFAVFFFLQRNTGITFTEGVSDPLSELFPKENTVVLVYKNEDENNADRIIAEMEADEHVKSILGYTNTLGKAHNAEDMSEAIGKLNGGDDISESFVRMAYYIKNDGALPAITVKDFMKFIKEEVLTNRAFRTYMDGSLTEHLGQFDRFSDEKLLTEPMDSLEMADFLGTDSENVRQLYLYYYLKNGGVDFGEMTLPEFVDFVLHTAANDETYAKMFDSAALGRLKQLQTFTDKNAMTKTRSYKEMASLLGIDTEQAKMMYVFYQSQNADYMPKGMTPGQFSSFMQNDVAANPLFQEYIDAAAMQQIFSLSAFTDKNSVQMQKRADELASLSGLEKKTVETIFALHNVQDTSGRTMTPTQFTGFLCDHLAEDPLAAAFFDDTSKQRLEEIDSLLRLSEAGTPLTASQMAQALGMEENRMRQLYFLYYSEDAGFWTEVSGMTMSLPEFLPLLKAQAPPEQQEQLSQTEYVADLASSGQALSASELASVTGMTEADAISVFDSRAYQTGDEVSAMSLTDFLETALALNPENRKLQQLYDIADAAASGTRLSASGLAGRFSMDPAQVQQIFGMALAPERPVTLPVFTKFLVERVLADSAHAGSFTEQQAQQLAAAGEMVQRAESGAPLSVSEAAGLFDMDEQMVDTAFRLYYGAGISEKTMSLADMTEFILADAALRGLLDEETEEQLLRLDTLIRAAVNDAPLTHTELSALTGMDEGDLKTLLTYREAQDGVFDLRYYMSAKQAVDFLAENSGRFAAETGGGLAAPASLQKIIHAAAGDEALSPSELASLLGMDRQQAQQLYLLKKNRSEEASSWRLSPHTFLSFIVSDVLEDKDFSAYFGTKTASDLKAADTLISAVLSRKAFRPHEMYALLSTLTEDVSEKETELLYLSYAGIRNCDPAARMTIPEFFDFLNDELLSDERFAGYFDEETENRIQNSRADLRKALIQMKGDIYSRLVFTTDYPEEAQETAAFIARLNEARDAYLEEDSYLVGTSAMVEEMMSTFHEEYLLISIITSIAIFLVVLLAFRNFFIPLVLTLLVQCGVYITVAVIGAWSGAMYYLALLIVQSILMGATIDYGIVFSNYYRESRQTLEPLKALEAAYEGSIHTVMTSGSILVLVLAILGIFSSSALIRQVCITLSIGALVAILLILFVLPGILACLDRFTAKKKAKRG